MSNIDELPELPSMVRDSQPVQPPRKSSGRLGMSTPQDYQDLYRRSLDDPGSYWVSVGSELEWISGWPPDPAMTGSLEEGFQYFPGAYGNASVNCVDRHAAKLPGKTAIQWIGEDGSERVWTYSELLEQTARFARALLEMGIKKGDVIAIFLPNLLETFATVQACYRIGAIYNIIFSGFSPHALADRIEDTGAKVVVTADETYRRGNVITLKKNLDSVLSRLPTIEHVVVVRRTGNADVPMSSPRDVYWDDLLASTTSLAEPVAMEANEPAFIIYTSGTSAKPKGLVHSGLGFLVGAYHNTKMALDLCDSDIYWCTADTGWLTFPIFELVGATAMGATMIAYEGALDFPSPDRFYEIVERFRVNKVFTAPTLLRMLARYGAHWLEKHDTSGIELISLVGEPLDAKTWHWTHDNIGNGQLEINNTYGQSETGSAWTSSVVGVTPARPGSCGPALPGHSYVILDNDNNPAPRGQVGFLALDKPFPTLFRDIWRDHDRYKTQYFTRLGPSLYDSADAALEDNDGHVWVVGRVDGVINVAAHRLSTMEMESALLSAPGVAEAAVIGVPDDTKGQVPVGFVTLAAGKDGTVSEADLAQCLVDSIGPIARPKQIYMLSAMPKTRSGKIVRRLLSELVTDGKATGDITGLEDPEVLDKLKAELTSQH